MSYVARILSGRYKVDGKNKKNRVRGSWRAFRGWGQDFTPSSDSHDEAQEPVTGFFRITPANRLKLFLDNGDGVFNRLDDDLLIKYNLKRRERKRFNRSNPGDFSVDYISWHIPPEYCSLSECYGSYYRVFMNSDKGNVSVSESLDFQRGEELFGDLL